MNFNPRVITINDEQQARRELLKINCDPAGVNIMSNKATFITIKLENVSTKAANLLKQTFLAKGGDVAVARGTADLSVPTTDVLIMATLKQYKLALTQLKSQPWGLPSIAASVENALKYQSFPVREYRWADKKLSLRPGRTLVMGILNLTPDSFSDGGKYNDLDKAVRHTEEMVANGADIIDIGAESTRPYGSEMVSAEMELERLMPILEKILKICPVPVSVDTYKASVAKAAVNAGAHIINDVWGLQYEPEMAKVAAEADVPIIIMHNQKGTVYERDVVSQVCEFLQHSIEIGINAGVKFDNFIIDPGIGFGKTSVHNLAILSRLAELKTLGCPILLGTSRKRFIGETLGGLEANDRVEGTAATVCLGMAQGVNIVRVHDVKAIARIVKMSDAILRGADNA
jgi:dihydropteroate synthase